MDSWYKLHKLADQYKNIYFLPLWIVGHNSPSINSWKLDSLTLKFQLKGALPYSPELLEPQPGLLRYILRQPYSREMVCTVIDIQKKVSITALNSKFSCKCAVWYTRNLFVLGSRRGCIENMCRSKELQPLLVLKSVYKEWFQWILQSFQRL